MKFIVKINNKLYKQIKYSNKKTLKIYDIKILTKLQFI
jgi:hypothetical protein